ncbi:MAG: RNA 2',3'-cyclic phosphodiesterase [Candidatus Eremiobacteraeota bacterium]|nr:RNA 2',3'-cyclic phosphodiesterase [Candidatus Eremiobacteraeota bacterium]
MRLFAAFDLDDSARGLAVELSARLQATGFVARFERPEKLHLTVAFLGHVTADRYADVVAALQTAAARSRAFRLTLDSIGAFPNVRHPRVVWVGSSSPAAEYTSCAQAVRAELGRLGWTFDQEPTAHVTIARAKNHSQSVPQVMMPAPVSLELRELRLYESLAAGPTTRYELRESFRLNSEFGRRVAGRRG